MKTIEEKSRELSDEYCDDPHAIFDDGFKTGVEFAQQWISVEDELPPVGELVLTKIVINDEVFYSLDSIICMETDDETFYQYPSWTEGDSTHWRPIERK